jgi:hypothetical protein
MSLTEEDKRWITELLDLQLERIETRLLTGFHKSPSPTELRLRSRTAVLEAIELEANLDSVKNLEETGGRPSAS